MFTDLRFSFRQLRKSPGFALIAIITLALGIGANTAIFSLFDQVMLRNMPVRSPKQLVLLTEHSQAERSSLHSHGDEVLYFSYPAYRQLRDRGRTLEGMLASAPVMMGLNNGTDNVQSWGELVSGNYFDVLGLRPVLGRLFTSADDVQRNGSPVIVLSYETWRDRFGSDPGVLSRTVMLNGYPYTIVGVVAEGFKGLSPEDVPALFVPISMQPQLMPDRAYLENPKERWINIVGRLKTGVSRATAEAALNSIWRDIRSDELTKLSDRSEQGDREFMSTHLFVDSGARGLPMLRDDFGTPMTALMAIVVAVLLIACSNVANLMLVRASGRRRETALRGVLGASHWRLFRYSISEGALLGIAAVGLGLLLGNLGLHALISAIPAEADLRSALTPYLDMRVLCFTSFAALITVFLFSIAPALATTRVVPITALHENSMAVRGSTRRTRNLLVCLEVMLSLVLLVVAGLFARTLLNMRTVDTGFRPTHLLNFDVNAKLLGRDLDSVRNEYQRMQEAIAGQSGVQGSAYSRLPLLSDTTVNTDVEIASYTPAPQQNMHIQMNSVSASFFSTLQIPLLAGRAFATTDYGSNYPVAIVNESFANEFFGSPAAAVGQHLCKACKRVSEKKYNEIVGVVKDFKSARLGEKAAPAFFLPFTQDAAALSATFFVRTSQDPGAAADSIRALVRGIDPALPVQDLASMEEHIDAGMFQQRLLSTLSVGFGLLAAFLASLGIYGVLAYSVSQRTQEIGVRMALGSTRTQVLKLVFTQVIHIAIAGIVTALPLVWISTRMIQSQLFGISRLDPWVIVSAIVLVLLLTGTAGLIPARRAASIEPMQALRNE